MASTIGRNIELFCDIRGLKSKDLADLIDVSAGTLSHIKNGSRQPSMDVLYKIADALNVSVLNLLLDQREIERFYCDDTIKAYYPGADHLKEILGQLIENNVAWQKTKRVAIIDLDDLEGK